MNLKGIEIEIPGEEKLLKIFYTKNNFPFRPKIDEKQLIKIIVIDIHNKN